MRLAIVTPIYPPIMGGASLQYGILSKYLMKNRVFDKIYVFTTFYKKTKIIEFKNITIIRCLKATSELPVINSLFLLFFVIWFNIDILHIHSSFSVKYLKNLCFIFKKIFFKPIIIDVRDHDSIANSYYFDYCFCVNKEIYNKILLYKKFKMISIIPPIISIPKLNDKYIKHIKNKYLLNKKYICFVGDVTPDKGILKLIKSFIYFKKQKKDYELVIIGRKFIKNFEKYLKNISIKYLGELSNKETLSIIKSSELLILPSKSEGMPRVCLEAIALETKVIFPSNKDFIKFCPKYVLKNFTWYNIYRIMIRILDDNAYDCNYPLKNHNPDIISKKIINLYYKIIKNS